MSALEGMLEVISHSHTSAGLFFPHEIQYSDLISQKLMGQKMLVSTHQLGGKFEMQKSSKISQIYRTDFSYKRYEIISSLTFLYILSLHKWWNGNSI